MCLKAVLNKFLTNKHRTISGVEGCLWIAFNHGFTLDLPWTFICPLANLAKCFPARAEGKVTFLLVKQRTLPPRLYKTPDTGAVSLVRFYRYCRQCESFLSIVWMPLARCFWPLLSALGTEERNSGSPSPAHRAAARGSGGDGYTQCVEFAACSWKGNDGLCWTSWFKAIPCMLGAHVSLYPHSSQQ